MLCNPKSFKMKIKKTYVYIHISIPEKFCQNTGRTKGGENSQFSHYSQYLPAGRLDRPMIIPQYRGLANLRIA